MVDASVPFVQPYLLTGSGRNLWATSTPGSRTRLERIDALSGKVIASTSVPDPISSLSDAQGWLWASTGSDLLQINPNSLAIQQTIHVAAMSPLNAQAGLLWCVVASAEGGLTVDHFAVGSPTLVAAVTLPSANLGWDVSAGQLLVDQPDATFERVDPLTGRAPGPLLRLPAVPGAGRVRLLTAGGAYWEVTATEVLRIDPL